MSLEQSLEKLRRSLEDGSVYEAQQLVKTVYHRLRSRQLLEESRDLLEKATCLQLEHGQVACGTELANLLVESYKEDRLPAEDTPVCRILRVLDALEATPSTGAEQYSGVVKAAIQWTKSVHASAAVTGQLHSRVGRYIWAKQGLSGLPVATAHFARSKDMRGFAEVLDQASEELQAGEPELLAINAVLQVLAVPHTAPSQQFECAHTLVKEIGGDKCCPADSPVGHFLALLLEALDRRSLELVRLLRREYGHLYSCDPGLDAGLDKLEVAYCGSKQRRNGLEGMFGSVLRSLMAGE